MIFSVLRRGLYSPSIYTNTNDLHTADKNIFYSLNRTNSFVCLYTQPTGILPVLHRRLSVHTDGILIRSTRRDSGIFTSFGNITDISREENIVLLQRENDKNLRVQISSDEAGETFYTLLSRSHQKYRI